VDNWWVPYSRIQERLPLLVLASSNHFVPPDFVIDNQWTPTIDEYNNIDGNIQR
jgi:hypothetical protein